MIETVNFWDVCIDLYMGVCVSFILILLASGNKIL